MALVTRGDVIALLLRALEKREGSHLLRRVVSPGKARVRMTWRQERDSIRNWFEIPQVEMRQNGLITGNQDECTYAYVARKFLAGNRLTALSLGSGSGSREISWAETGKFERIIGIDVSEERVKSARMKLAETRYADIVEFVAGDAMQYQFESESFDVVIAEGILHHLSPVETALESIHRTLKPGGIVIVNEYVGPDRFQWSEDQLRYCNALLALLPVELRTYRGTTLTKSRVFRPGTLSMLVYDPSEAIESSKIIGALERKFNVLERRDYGGTILQPLLKDISHHFIEMTPEKEEALRLLFRAEDFLLGARLIESDFTFAVAQKKAA
ncbi:MAG: class I SAM-dependent methyltransferase [Bacteroidetes bacterium]|nr:class I SAM-dependent methyltransferase [Bacteroidota bacterium]